MLALIDVHLLVFLSSRRHQKGWSPMFHRVWVSIPGVAIYKDYQESQRLVTGFVESKHWKAIAPVLAKRPGIWRFRYHTCD